MDSIKLLMRHGFIQPIENDKWEWESGPNAILLSDVSIQNGAFCNLTEFPVLHMMYKQGMAIEEHPGYTGVKPLIIGVPEQISGQINYLDRGLNGLTIDEINSEKSLTQNQKQELITLKHQFKGKQIARSKEVINFFTINNNEEPYEIANSLNVVRLGLNVYLFQYGEQEEIIDLTLTEDQAYEIPYDLDYHPSTRRDFSVLHTGDGNGWDKNRPSMSSVLSLAGKYYLIDAGPNILESLHYCGISLNEIEGLFQTHCHDDHFSGIASIIRSEKRIKFFSTVVVRHSIMQKLAALMEFDFKLFKNFFEVCDLEFDKWNVLPDFEVMPILSPHPVETNIFYFRKKSPCKNNQENYRSYGHLADIVSRRVFQEFISNSQENGTGNTQLLTALYEKTWQNYLRPVNIKKIDVNGGLIHGDAEDFYDDSSGKVIFSHTSSNLTLSQREHGSNAVFGEEELLISATIDYLRCSAASYLSSYFPRVSQQEKWRLLANSLVILTAGAVIIKKGSNPSYVYLTLSGVAEYINTSEGLRYQLNAGSFLGDTALIEEQVTSGTFRALSYVKALKIPSAIFKQFIFSDIDRQHYRTLIQLRKQLHLSTLFKPLNNRFVIDRMTMGLHSRSFKENELLKEEQVGGHSYVSLITEGMLGIFYQDILVETLSAGGYFGQHDQILNPTQQRLPYSVVALAPTKILRLPFNLFLETPLLLWSLVEVTDKLHKQITQTARLASTQVLGDSLVLPSP